MNAVLFRSKVRFESFKNKLSDYGINYTVLNFDSLDWLDYDFSKVDIIIYYPLFQFSSNCPLALQEVQDNLLHIHSRYPGIKMYPDPKIIGYYNDKYRQYLFMKANNFPMPLTLPLYSQTALKKAEDLLGFPMVIKNRYGAGGGYVFKVSSQKELEKYYKLSTFNFFNLSSASYFVNLLLKRIFYYHLIKEKKMPYPFLSYPLLAQKFIPHDRDLKTVVGNYKVVEAHWRRKADELMWKVNIDGGGIGEWSQVPQEAIELSIRLAQKLKTSWVNLDLLNNDGQYLITEFSPVWHHYAYKEKASFVYKEDYNIDTPLEISLDLERMIIESLISDVNGEARKRQ